MQSEARCAFIDTDTSWILREVCSLCVASDEMHCEGLGTKRLLLHFVKHTLENRGKTGLTENLTPIARPLVSVTSR